MSKREGETHQIVPSSVGGSSPPVSERYVCEEDAFMYDVRMMVEGSGVYRRGLRGLEHPPQHLRILYYRIARNFRGLKFSRISLSQTFRDLIFEDCVRARRMLTVGKLLEDKIFEVRH